MVADGIGHAFFHIDEGMIGIADFEMSFRQGEASAALDPLCIAGRSFRQIGGGFVAGIGRDRDLHFDLGCLAVGISPYGQWDRKGQ